MSRFLSQCKAVIFPRLCLYCSSPLAEKQKLLCSLCLGLLELLDSQKHCAGCLKEGPSWCHECHEKCPSYDFASACFDYSGPIQAVIKEFKYNDAPYLAKSLASFLFLQFDAAGWPCPEYITFVPQTLVKRFWRGYNQSELLAKELGKLMNRDVRKLITKRLSGLPQSLLEKNDRKGHEEPFFCINPQLVEGRRILLIDDVFTTGTTVEQASKALRACEPSEIYVLTISAS
jgi:ComF family protein